MNSPTERREWGRENVEDNVAESWNLANISLQDFGSLYMQKSLIVTWDNGHSLYKKNAKVV